MTFSKCSFMLIATVASCLFASQSSCAQADTGTFTSIYPLSETNPDLSSIDEPAIAKLGYTAQPHISNDGRFVVFESDASNLVADDRNWKFDVFVRDRQAQTTTRVSLAADGRELTDHSDKSTISGNGQRIAFHTDAPELREANGQYGGIYVVDRFGNFLTQACASASGVFGNNGCVQSTMAFSDDGSLLVFDSTSSNLAGGDSFAEPDVFVRNLNSGALTLLSRSANGKGGGAKPVISGNGRYVAFVSDSADLVMPAQTASRPQLHIVDLSTGVISRPTLSNDDQPLSDDLDHYSFSRDGRYLVFHTRATNLGEFTGSWEGVYRYDQSTKTIASVAIKESGQEMATWSQYPVISPDGNHVLFSASPDGLTSNAPEYSSGLFLRDMDASATMELNFNFPGSSNARPQNGVWSLTEDADEVLFISYDHEVSTLDVQDPQAVPVRHPVSVPDKNGPFASVATDVRPSIGCMRQVSRNGRYAVFDTMEYRLGDAELAEFSYDAKYVYLFDRSSRNTELVSVNSDGIQADGGSDLPSISSDGRYVAYRSYASNLSSEYENGTDGAIFIRDRQLGTTTVGTDDGFGNVMMTDGGEISGNGKYLVFSSWNVPGQVQPSFPDQVYRRDLTSGDVVLVSVGVDGLPASMPAKYPVISEDGRYVAFASHAPNLSNLFFSSEQVWLRDLEAGTTRLLSSELNGYAGAGTSKLPCISPNGRFVAFSSDSNLDGASGFQTRAYLFDSASNSLKGIGALAPYPAGLGALSVSDRSVVFAGSDVMHEYNIESGTSRHVSIDASGNARRSDTPRVSADGTTIMFVATERWLVSAPTNKYSYGTVLGTIGSHDFSGVFYDPANSGHGWLFEQLETGDGPLLAATWYAYRDGKQLWMLGTALIEGDRATVPMTLFSGGDFPPDFDPGSVTTQAFGMLEIVMDDSDHGHATWTSEVEGLGSGEADFVRLTTISSSNEADQLSGCHSGGWYDPQQSGHGLQLQVLDSGDTQLATAVWYHYLDGEPRWLLGSGVVDGDHADLSMAITHGPDFPPNYDPADKVQEPWGTLRFTVSGANQAQIVWDADFAGYGDGSMNLKRLTQLDGHACVLN